MYFEEFEKGQRFRLDPITLTAEEIEDFAQRYDPQPIHIDQEFADRGIFKGIIASGFHTLAVVWAAWIRTNRFGQEIIGGVGMDQIRWFKPVRAGDNLYSEVEVLDLEPQGTRGLVSLKFTVTNDREETVMVTIGRVFLKSHPAK